MCMKLKLKFWLFIFSLFVGNAMLAQNITVKGRVTKKTSGEALAGATVAVKGTALVTVTDMDGNFTLSVKEPGATIVTTFVGFTQQEKKVNGGEPVNFIMEESSGTLQDLVVIGYGTQKVTKVSGAISTLKSAEIEKLKPVRIEEALQGNVSGVNVIQSGSPGAKPTVLIRGIPNLGGTDPTVIVDGIQQTLQDLNSISPADIESVTVLKDAATTAIYGVKGGNGVIVITTKSGRKNQKTEISLNSSYSLQEVINTIPVLNATEYGAMLNEGSTLSGGNIIIPDLSVLGVGTDWQNQIFKRAPINNHTISARGGSERMTYFLSGGYLAQGGIVGGYDKSRFNRLNFTSNLSFDLSSKLKFIVNATYNNFNGRGVQENAFNSIIGSAVNYDPTVPVYNNVPNTVGQYGFSNLITREIYNPLTKLENTYNQLIGHKLYGKFELQYEVIKNLRLSARFGYTKYDGNAKSFDPLVFWGLNNTGNTLNADGSTIPGFHNSVTHEKSTSSQLIYEGFANYAFKIGTDHDFDITAGINLNKGIGNAAGASRQDVPFNSWEFADFTAATGSTANNNANGLRGYYYQYSNRHASGFVRLNYDYQDKYLLSFTGRRDGSYAFGTENKFGNFYSGSLGWVMSNENFFNIDFINNLKIRGSYGSVGNDNNLDPKRVLVTIQTDYLASLYGSGNSIGYTFGNIFYPGSTVASIANNALQWEKQSQLNAGFDATVLKNKLTISADYFEKRTEGLLFTPIASGYLGTIPPPIANIGSTKSSGIDVTLGVNTSITKDLRFTSTITFTKAKNLVTKTGEDGSWVTGGNYFNGQSQSVTIFAPGYAPATYYGYKTNGLFQSWEEISKSPTQTGAQPGDIRFADINGDGTIDANDRTVIGNPFPDFTMGWNAGFTFKNFDFTVFTYASVGNDVYRAFERNDNYTNKYRGVLGRWTGPGTTNDANNPRYSFVDANNNNRVSDRFVEDGSFVKIKNILLGYTLPAKATGKAFKSFRVYVQVKNAFTFTKYEGFDPEIPGFGLLDTGIDRGAYPQARSYIAGIDIKF
jgi:TonB-linked SusC/RagA family outer membrane protein